MIFTNVAVMRSGFLFFVFVTPLYSLAQIDSTVTYKNKQGERTVKDSAFIYDVVTKNTDLWHGKVYYAENNRLQSEGDYADADLTTPVGRFDNYLEDGALSTTCNYNKGRLVDRIYYYKDGTKKSYIAYTDKGIAQQKGWDESGKEIPGFIVEQEARFPGNDGAWNRYIEKHLNPVVAVESGMSAGKYEVIVQFSISKDGTVIDVKAISFTGNCKACAAEAVSVFTNSPVWQPAIQNNEPVIYRQRQKVVFFVTDEKRNKKN